MSLLSKLNIGIIGLGYWGHNVLRNFVNHSRIQLRYACDIDSSIFENTSIPLPKHCKCVTDVSAVLNDPDVDAVSIVTPAETHFTLVKEALLAGKHVLCEKPLTLNPKDGEELIKTARKVNRKLMTGYTFIYNNGIRKLKELYDLGELGQLYYMTLKRTHMGMVRSDVDVIWDLVPHDVAIINFILGHGPERVMATGAKPLGTSHYDVAFITLFYPKGILGQIHVSWVDSNKERLVRFIGDKARAEFNDLNNLEPIRIFKKGISLSDRIEADYGNFRFLLRDGDILSPKIDMFEPLKKMIDAFVNAVLDDREIIANDNFSLEVTKVISGIQKSLSSQSIEKII